MSKADQVITYATAEIGKPYSYGDEGPSSFDCSGLMQFVFAKIGIRLPRTAAQQQRFTQPVTAGDARPGDLVFWNTPASHVGLYLGGGKMIAAPHTGAKVRIQDVYGTPSGYGRVQGLGLAAAFAPVAAGGANVAQWLSGARYGLIELAAAGTGLSLIGYGLWRTLGSPSIRKKVVNAL